MTSSFFGQIIRLIGLSFLMVSMLVVAMLFIGDQNEGDVIAFIGPQTDSQWFDGRFAVNSYDVQTRLVVSVTPPNLYPWLFGWSQNGDYIAFIARFYGDVSNTLGLYIMRSDGRDLRLISGDLLPVLANRQPFWTETGQHIVFQAQQAGSNLVQFYRAFLDGTPPQLADINDEDVQNYIQTLFPTYFQSPNRDYIVQIDFRDNEWGLYLIHKGQRQKIYQLATTAEERIPDAPDWSPDSTRIAFPQRLNNVSTIRIISLTGEVLFDIPQGRYPLWKP